MKRMIVAFSSLFLWMACGHDGKIDVAKEKEAMKQADINFSNLSKKKGMKEAFLQYMDTAGVLLRPNHSPVKGRDAMQLIWGMNDTSFVLVWTPQAAELASSGDLGYTYGVWTSYQKKWLSDSISQGTYVSIWKKQNDGSWKYVLDTGNPGLGKQK